MTSLKLTTKRACRAIGMNRDRFNEHVAAGNFPCAPDTIAGRARYFDQHDMLALALFKMNLDDGYPADRAGHVACAVAKLAAASPNEDVIAYVQNFVGMKRAILASEMTAVEHWQDKIWSGSTLRKVELFNVAEQRKRVLEAMVEEANMIGEDES